MQPGRLVDSVYQSLRDDILNNYYAEGAAIPEVSVAARFDIARPTARAAVERLIGDGLLVRSGYKAASVPLFSEKDIRELYGSRSVLEGFIHRGLAERRTTPPDAVAANLTLRAAAAAGRPTEVTNADIKFHRSLVAAYGNDRMTRMHALLMGEAHLCMAQVQVRHALRAEIIAEEHDAILDAITHGQPDEADRLTSYHLNHAQETLLGLRAQGAIQG